MKRMLSKQITAAFLCVVMILCMLPNELLRGSAEDVTVPIESGNKTADAGSINGWKTYFDQEVMNTAGSNRIWTDKSVFTSAEAYKTMLGTIPSESTNSAHNALSVRENNFLVSLSAMAATTEITGYAGNPTDTVLILDLSQSMDNSKYIPTLVSATNTAITKLLGQNQHNRISVVLYSGNTSTNTKANLSNATTLLPLDRYTAGSDKTFISYTGSNSDTTVVAASGVKNSQNKTVSGSKQTIGGTYIQAGLYLASKEFETASKNGTTVIDESLLQGGTKRIPVITLMSDGLPTIATDEYCTFERSATTGSGFNQTTVYGVSNYGNGSSNTNTITFLTQLTAKWLKESACKWYDNQALFYSVWVKSASDSSTNATLDPSSSNNVLDGWWKTFLNQDSGKITFSDDTTSFTVTRDSVIKNVPAVTPETEEYTSAWLTEQNYVDKAFSATNATDFENAFTDIVNTINTQSLRFPTYMTSVDANTDGYITIEDPLGDFMEVKALKGAAIGGYLFDGTALVDLVADSDLDTKATLTADETTLIQSLQTRLRVNDTVAKALIANAIEYGQIGYNATTGEYSNFIGWYADKDNRYLGFWHEGHSEDDMPDNAAKTVKSYVFFDKIAKAVSNSNITDSNLVHLFVDVITQTNDAVPLIRVAIPASLLPQMTYKASINALSLDQATQAILIVAGADNPLRVLVEVGLHETINELTVNTLMKDSGYTCMDANGNYLFYTNRWNGNKTDSEKLLVGLKSTAVSHYQPSLNNPSYYYDGDQKIYADTAGTLYTSTEKPAGATFYRAISILQATGTDNKATIQKVYEAISETALSKAQKNAEDDGWYIPTGTAIDMLKKSSVAKADNTTGTLSFVSSCDIPGMTDGVYDVYEQLGNNGLVSIKASKTIELTKKITTLKPNSDTEDFVFNLQFTSSGNVTLPTTLKVTYDGTTYQSVQTDAVSVILDNNQTVSIFGLPDQAYYSITEEPHSDYIPVQQTVSGVLSDAPVTYVEYLNRPLYTGGLTVTKKVNHPFGEDDDGLEALQFSFIAQLTDENGTPLSGRVVRTSVGELTTDNDGGIAFKLKNNETFAISELADGITVTVTERNVSDGFTADSITKQHTVENEQVHGLVFTNTYTSTPLSDADIRIIGTKMLNGRDWQSFDSYRFCLEYFDGENWQLLAGGTDDTVTSGKPDFSLTDVMQAFVFDKEGEHSFRITEQAGELGGITYDSEPRTFTVSVSDNWNGGYEVTAVTTTDPRVNITTTAQGGQTAYTVETNFINTYESTDTYIDLCGSKQLLGDSIAAYDGKDDFRFNLYTAVSHNNTVVKEHFIVSATLNDNNTFFFDHKDIPALNFDRAGTYYYVLDETMPNADPLIVMDEGYYEIKVVVTDNYKGTLTAALTVTRVDSQKHEQIAADDIVFVNRRKPAPVAVTIPGIKRYNVPLPNSLFSFSLYAATLTDGVYAPQGAPLITTHNASDGTFSIKDSSTTNYLTFEAAGEYHFVISEDLPTGVTADSPKNDGVTYDTTSYGVTVTVTEETNSVGRDLLVAKTTINGSEDTAVTFSNYYNPFSPVYVTISGTNALADEIPTDGDFTFELYAAAPDGEIIGDAISVQTTVNGVFTFDQLCFGSYEDMGEYYYVVKERIPADVDADNTKDGIVYDSSVYLVKLTVSDNGDKTIKVTTAITVDGVGVNEIAFSNGVKGPETPIPTPPEEDKDSDMPTSPEEEDKDPDTPTSPSEEEKDSNTPKRDPLPLGDHFPFRQCVFIVAFCLFNLVLFSGGKPRRKAAPKH